MMFNRVVVFEAHGWNRLWLSRCELGKNRESECMDAEL
jgi:hypothetical protein